MIRRVWGTLASGNTMGELGHQKQQSGAVQTIRRVWSIMASGSTIGGLVKG